MLERPGIGGRLITIIDEHRNGPRIVLIFATLAILATWASIGLHIRETRQ